MKRKGISSQALRGICSLTFDVEEGSCDGNATSYPVESSGRSPGTDTAGDTVGHQREPKQSQAHRETRTSFAAAEDVCSEPQRSSVRETDVTAEEDDGTNHAEEDESQTAADVLESTQDVPGSEEKKESQTTKLSEPEPDELSERQGSPSAPEAVTGNETTETLNEACVGELDGQDTVDDDVGVMTEEPPKPREQAELKDEEAETTKEATEEDNLEQPESDVESFTVLSKHTERLISRKRDDQKRDSRSRRCLKVHQASLVTLQGVSAVW